jgi:hypothetical protein
VEAPWDDIENTTLEKLNYYNYFTEVEEEFVRRRGAHIYISTADWALVETWKNKGIPLHLVLRAINEAFDQYDRQPRKRGLVNTLFYCQQSVEITFDDYKLSQVGAAAPEDSTAASQKPETATFTRESLLEFLTRCRNDIDEIPPTEGMEESLARASERLDQIKIEIAGANRIDAQSLEQDLDVIDRMLLENLKAALGEERLKAIHEEAVAHLKHYRKKMDKAFYEQTVENFVARRLREAANLPRLSLFYM